jgi:NAD dependent epimerase/dehydratase family enzyme
VLPTPLLPLKLRFGPELVETLLLVSQRVQPARLETTGYQFTCRSLDAAFDAILRRGSAGRG